MNARISSSTVLVLAVLGLAGCGENPAANVSPAVVSDAKPADAPVAPTPVVAPKTEPAAPTEAAKTTATATTTTTPAPTTTAPAAASTVLAISGDTGSKIDFIGSKIGGSHNGGFKTWSGTVDLTADKTAVAKIAVEIDAKSLWSDDEKLTAHLKNADFFDVDKYPKSTFVTTEIKTGGDKGASHTLVGNLTLHGVTKSIQIPATVKVTDGAATLTSEFSFKRSDFGMPAGGKLALVHDEVVVKLDVKTAKKG